MPVVFKSNAPDEWVFAIIYSCSEMQGSWGDRRCLSRNTGFGVKLTLLSPKGKLVQSPGIAANDPLMWSDVDIEVGKSLSLFLPDGCTNYWSGFKRSRIIYFSFISCWNSFSAGIRGAKLGTTKWLLGNGTKFVGRFWIYSPLRAGRVIEDIS